MRVPAIVLLVIFLVLTARLAVAESFRPTWVVGDVWHVQVDGHGGGAETNAQQASVADLPGPVVRFEVLEADALHARIRLTGPAVETRELIFGSERTLREIRVLSPGHQLIWSDHNDAGDSAPMLLLSGGGRTVLDFPAIPSGVVDETRTFLLPNGKPLTQAVTFSGGSPGDMTVVLSVPDNGDVLRITQVWKPGSKWWTSATRKEPWGFERTDLLIDVPMDSDGDGLDDGTERVASCDAARADTDGDGLSDYEELVTRHTRCWDPSDHQGSHPLGGKKLQLKDNADPAKKRLNVQSKDLSLNLGGGNGSADDPVAAGSGGTLRVRTAAGCASGPCDTTYALTDAWSYVGKGGENKGYKYKSKTGLIRSVSLKPGKLLKVTGTGALGHALAANPAPVDIVLQLGSSGQRYCLEFGGIAAFKPGTKSTTFKAKDAAAPATCPQLP